jgi:hypothetical protein
VRKNNSFVTGRGNNRRNETKPDVEKKPGKEATQKIEAQSLINKLLQTYKPCRRADIELNQEDRKGVLRW